MAAPDLPIGDRIRHHRTHAGRRQDVIAGLVGISPDYLGQIERGLKTPTIQVLHAIAQELGVPTSALLSETAPAANMATDSADPSIRRALMGYGPSASSAPTPLPALRERIEGAWRSWQTSPARYTEASATLPGLIADTEHAARAHRGDPIPHRDAQRCAADLYFLLRSYLRRTGRTDLSLVAADRAVRAAEAADDPIRIAGAQWNLAHILLASGEPEGAEEVAARTTEGLAPAASAGNRDSTAMTGALLLVTAVAASRRRNWWEARDRLAEAGRLANRTGEGNTCWTVWGPTNVELHRVSIEMEAGEAGEALRLADRIDTGPMPSREREFTFGLEIARCHDLRREDAAVLLQLLELEELAPEDLARQDTARDMLLGLMRRARRAHARQAEGLAERIGIL